jgi:hypothetical protein
MGSAWRNKNRTIKDKIFDFLWDVANFLVPVIAFIIVAAIVVGVIAFILSIALGPMALVCYTAWNIAKLALGVQ